MTTATSSTRTIKQHRFQVPTAEPIGAAYRDLHIALHWAEQKAEQLGIDQSYDDWCCIHSEGDSIVIIITEEVSA